MGGDPKIPGHTPVNQGDCSVFNYGVEKVFWDKKNGQKNALDHILKITRTMRVWLFLLNP